MVELNTRTLLPGLEHLMDNTTEQVFFSGKRDGYPQNWYDWRWQYKNRIRRLRQLAVLLNYPSSLCPMYEKLVRTYPLCITPYYLSLIDRNDKHDPIGKQCFPDLKEIDLTLGGVADPLQEEARMPVPGVVHRYPDRCLVMVTNDCATYCRHCNRKRRWGSKVRNATTEELLTMIGYISNKPAIREVIISGGDPLTLNVGTLDWFLGALRAIPHVEVLRLGSRIPVVLPMRITRRLCRLLSRHKPLWFNTQFNHINEITKDSARACEMLLEAGIPVSNQSVLLKGVNNTFGAMRSLLYGLQRIGVKPYYLFQCDPVEGTDHFRADQAKGIEMMEQLRKTISGLCMPSYVLDTPGEEGKILLGSCIMPKSYT